MVEICGLVWDEFNTNHLTKHGVNRLEVDEACRCPIKVLQGKKGRILLMGVTKGNRLISVVLDYAKQNRYYPVTARDSSRKERRYANQK